MWEMMSHLAKCGVFLSCDRAVWDDFLVPHQATLFLGATCPVFFAANLYFLFETFWPHYDGPSWRGMMCFLGFWLRPFR